MNDIKTRQTQPDDIPVLQSIWDTVFGDTGRAAFFSHFYTPELSICVDCEGVPAAVGYLLSSGDLVYDSKTVPGAMIYGVSTKPVHRGKGFGTAVVRELVSLAYKHGFSAVSLCPSDDSLFEYYSTRAGFRDWFFINERSYTPEEIMGYSSNGRYTTSLLTRMTPGEYNMMREALLEDTPHIKHSVCVFEFQSMMCGELGGGLFKYGSSCAVVERQQDGAIWIKELLSPAVDPGELRCFLSLIVFSFSAENYIVRTPAGVDISSDDNLRTGVRRFGMLTAIDHSLITIPVDSVLPWYGMAFD